MHNCVSNWFSTTSQKIKCRCFLVGEHINSKMVQFLGAFQILQVAFFYLKVFMIVTANVMCRPSEILSKYFLMLQWKKVAGKHFYNYQLQWIFHKLSLERKAMMRFRVNFYVIYSKGTTEIYISGSYSYFLLHTSLYNNYFISL